MNERPKVVSGKFSAGASCVIGRNVVVDVAEEVIIGDRCVISDNAYLCGRRIEVGDDCFFYSHWNKRLEVGLGRRDEEDAILKIGSRATCHDNRIDLAKHVTIGNDVGLSPEVCIYTHSYWQSPLDGYPMRHAPVTIGDGVIVGFRSCILPGASIANNCVIGAQSVVTGLIGNSEEPDGGIYAGNPAKFVRHVEQPCTMAQRRILDGIIKDYVASCKYRNIDFGEIIALDHSGVTDFVTFMRFRGCVFDFEKMTFDGVEDEYVDDLRWHFFKHGLKFFSRRPFTKMGRR